MAKPQEQARARKRAMAKTISDDQDGSSPPLPPPAEPPSGDECGSDEEEKGKGEEKVVLSKSITQFKHHFKVALEGGYRKFMVSSFGSEGVTICACEAFKSSANKIMNRYDLYGSKKQDKYSNVMICVVSHPFYTQMDSNPCCILAELLPCRVANWTSP